MDVKIRQDRQDDRTRILESLIRHEGRLDNRMYSCADYLVSAGTVEHSDTLAGWAEWKKENPSQFTQTIL
ncbi:hypothetical protein Syn7803C72_61 [Synechococcus phage ACG-2014d]|jgi:hypothetical protein|uniref:Uncharacterized protein n=1 Tax=Synechococcus phage ACG-2014d TaxID=1493509 RepID=A0A0E3FCD1_9CAUD|nr:hypothetical protein AAJ59_gp061 [Synechococcus phage ACG-2014d]YP_010355231.1 hypothetical protein M1M12_gp062 [Synechococcus phage ACG-2014d]AIX14673.1 hypothetical protein Syn7803C45_62 [Synechococcus phage ACG-2014d]AIX14892.1 hypothetical protein Syn7803C46_61 [Synechococcus phage ACG-2014d]AIX15319.1 hypothetical protein Syn7803C48_61 [Synechococcus phage ACG-2014d]AIX15537.1 hypothetical protein Syn7803C49_61 [Synechococcus phage ACG-2014d]AIX15966.1 hypothetical protein Syn7803C54_